MFRLPPSSFTFSTAFGKATALMLKPKRDDRVKFTIKKRRKVYALLDYH